MSSYEELQAKIEASIKKEEGRQHAVRRKKAELAEIKKGGGGHAIAKRILSSDVSETDFNYGHNDNTSNTDQGSESCLGRVVCERCKKFHGYCRDVEEKVKMLPTGDRQESTGRGSRTGGLNFINTSDLSMSPTEGKILMVKFKETTSNGKKSPNITIKLAFKGEMRYIWVPCRKDDARYATLLAAFGPDENNWVDERIQLLLEKDDFSENYQVKIQVPTKGKK